MTEKSMNVHPSNEAMAAAGGRLTLWQSLANSQPSLIVPKPPPPHKFVAAAAARLSHVLTCPPTRQEKEQRKKVDGKAELMKSFQTSVNGGKHASAYPIY